MTQYLILHHLLQRGPPLVPVQLTGSGEECEKCPCGQQCLYIPGDRAEGRVAGSHITPVIRYRDDLFFQAIQGDENSCELFGHSHSTVGRQKTPKVYTVFDVNLLACCEGSGVV